MVIQKNSTQRSVRTRRLGLAGAGAAATIVMSSAEAGIISSGLVNQVVNLSTSFNLDIDGDGSSEFQFAAILGKSSLGNSNPQATLVNSNSILDNWIYVPGNSNPQQLAANGVIDNGRNFTQNINGFITSSYFPSADWNSPFPDSGFMGVSFDLGGSSVYGWIEITANSDTEIVLNQWAYEDVAGVEILAGDTGSVAVPTPSTILLFTIAAGGLMIMRYFKRDLYHTRLEQRTN